MRIGFDFDNTIVSYDALFHRVAREQGAVPPDIAVSKLAVRDHLRHCGREALWTEMQGVVYGARLNEAAAYPGAIAILRQAREAGHGLAIISHKTRHPFLGPRYDLHAAARAWVDRHLHVAGRPLVPPDDVFFELSQTEKLARIGALGCDAFVDDLPEILLAPGFPASTRRILFDPERHHAPANVPGCDILVAWEDLSRLLD